MARDRRVAVIAPDLLAQAFSVLIHSAPNHSLLAFSTNLGELRDRLGQNKPDVMLVYLLEESELCAGQAAFEMIAHIRAIWPLVLCIAIVKYASQLDKAKQFGADLVFVDGVNAKQLLAAMCADLAESQ